MGHELGQSSSVNFNDICKVYKEVGSVKISKSSQILFCYYAV
jgi:hypothetical protein